MGTPKTYIKKLTFNPLKFPEGIMVYVQKLEFLIKL